MEKIMCKAEEGAYNYKGRVMHPHEILKEIMGDHPYRYNNWDQSGIQGWFLEDPKLSNYQDTFAEAGRAAMIIDVEMLVKAGVKVNV